MKPVSSGGVLGFDSKLRLLTPASGLCAPGGGGSDVTHVGGLVGVWILASALWFLWALGGEPADRKTCNLLTPMCQIQALSLSEVVGIGTSDASVWGLVGQGWGRAGTHNT